VAVAAVEAAADAGYRPELGPAHRVAKLYYTAVPKSLLAGGRQMAEQLGISPDDFFSLDEIERIGTDDDDVTTTIDVTAYADKKFRALEAHRTQLGTTARFLQIPEDIRAVVMGAEHYVLVRRTGAAVDRVEVDLFEGI
jgi:N-acetyl-1-D-myo-inositol-2-amino-2-deoxy-alpha-D-glucopyranoside deacetylase